MAGYVFDASAFLAIVRNEPGADAAIAKLPGAAMSAVNASEALMHGAEKGAPVDMMRQLLRSHRVDLVTFGEDLAVATAQLRAATKKAGLSFADRACIATAVRLDATVVTADRVWGDLDLPCAVELIR